MHLIILYGPPGVGKLTVAKELVNKTGYKLFHNHLSIDLVSSLFDRTTEAYPELNRAIRLLLIKTAAQHNLPGVIFTYGYVDPIGNKLISPLLELAKEHDISIDFVYLTCSEEEQYKRIESPSRQGTTKLHSKKELKIAQELLNFTQIPYVESFVIDNTKLSPEEVATMIIEQFNLPLT